MTPFGDLAEVIDHPNICILGLGHLDLDPSWSSVHWNGLEEGDEAESS